MLASSFMEIIIRFRSWLEKKFSKDSIQIALLFATTNTFHTNVVEKADSRTPEDFIIYAALKATTSLMQLHRETWPPPPLSRSNARNKFIGNHTMRKDDATKIRHTEVIRSSSTTDSVEGPAPGKPKLFVQEDKNRRQYRDRVRLPERQATDGHAHRSGQQNCSASPTHRSATAWIMPTPGKERPGAGRSSDTGRAKNPRPALIGFASKDKTTHRSVPPSALGASSAPGGPSVPNLPRSPGEGSVARDEKGECFAALAPSVSSRLVSSRDSSGGNRTSAPKVKRLREPPAKCSFVPPSLARSVPLSSPARLG
ncbi:hypothetical protein Mp_2g14150 [Marchantia polymorpha subsp. ruderalis]|uniref:Uncharacterized protein n=1 Tax=Marchantia polymorpha TaxID=3197 RepID=A0A2R6X1N1_MARPO|nr:hypothetical protein MARPO_0042s0042 [Marchantia polymorpha]BBN02297.1 hypothetical protein Mp_2g14150 [Marchantia polymorpha subsp. ruderalis]|eukprot:PTQ39996.1 hypothetical protein MARPO_0042s0042 [Marchantia polymorpha]